MAVMAGEEDSKRGGNADGDGVGSDGSVAAWFHAKSLASMTYTTFYHVFLARDVVHGTGTPGSAYCRCPSLYVARVLNIIQFQDGRRNSRPQLTFLLMVVPLARIHGTAVQESWSLKLKLNPRAIVDNSEVKSRRLMMYLSALPAILYNASRGTSSQGPKVRHLAEKKHRSPAPLNYVA
ncbi:hypothetical protein CISG_00803 [Coccidioides immitis RMSCC 3703]|uniref:Uncharacterized protein n=1 Tax=Coccidioides immitis RMSCC 3703 TaxID=454286 RepID=A0A0J8QUC9_COCIT|nr:hypothetical protein CISG_00803 [Coccidioides immitis RMSCC 3703]